MEKTLNSIDILIFDIKDLYTLSMGLFCLTNLIKLRRINFKINMKKLYIELIIRILTLIGLIAVLVFALKGMLGGF